MKRVTIKDISKHLLLSTSTVSRALTDDKNIRKETREKVLEAAKELGYKPNPSALNLKSGKSNSIGVIVPEMITPFSSKILEGIQNVLSGSKFRVIVAQSNENPETERTNLLMMEEFRVDGIIINLCHETYNHKLYQEILDRGTPMIFFDRIPPSNLDVPKVLVNDQSTSTTMVEHLISTGKKRIVNLMGPKTIRNAIQRADGYKKALYKYKLFDDDLVIETEGTSFIHAKEAMKRLIEKGVVFDAIFAFTDSLAIGAMNYLLEKKYRIPEDVAIASFSGTELSQMVFPPLSTVEQPLVEMGETAVELLLEKIKNPTSKNRFVQLKPELIFRRSTIAQQSHQK
ncbi:LacI family DNA-binding transcriptional regulator [Marinoscillum pacificum]|uniref:LacI family DNA-binding transcriptional regulator n=1 Tax=Marinoscillum pacificum TaxID=392723 RepID=UPI002158590B|nr:LacI family DNA-binding transcriptional regulator [Marinoscillum pacificum]